MKNYVINNRNQEIKHIVRTSMYSFTMAISSADASTILPKVLSLFIRKSNFSLILYNIRFIGKSKMKVYQKKYKQIRKILQIISAKTIWSSMTVTNQSVTLLSLTMHIYSGTNKHNPLGCGISPTVYIYIYIHMGCGKQVMRLAILRSGSSYSYPSRMFNS